MSSHDEKLNVLSLGLKLKQFIIKGTYVQIVSIYNSIQANLYCVHYLFKIEAFDTRDFEHKVKQNRYSLVQVTFELNCPRYWLS